MTLRVPRMLLMMTKAHYNRHLRWVCVDTILRIVTQITWCCMQSVKKGKKTWTMLQDQVVVKRNKKKGKRGANIVNRWGVLKLKLLPDLVVDQMIPGYLSHLAWTLHGCLLRNQRRALQTQTWKQWMIKLHCWPGQTSCYLRAHLIVEQQLPNFWRPISAIPQE
jgi:hypothetical protein